jgi:hypothetical protein
MWHGSQPPQTLVQFRFAGSNSTSGPWLYLGPDGTENSTYDSGPDVSVPVNYSYYNNMRYYRYRVLLFSDLAQTVTPRVDDVILNWSP